MAILLVDDNASLRKLMRVVLCGLSHELLFAADECEAMRLWEAHSQSIVLLVTDIHMAKGMNGITLAETLRGMRPQLPVLFISGFSNLFDRLGKLVDGKLTQFLEKPFLPEQLEAAVKNVLCFSQPIP